MADVRAVVNTAVNTGGVLNKVLQGLIDGRVKANIDKYTALGTEAAGSTIKFGKALPTGSNIIGHILVCDGATASLTMSVGDADSATRFLNASTAFQSAANYALALLGAGRVVGTSTSDNQPLVTTGGATLTVGHIWTLITLYTND